MCGMAVKKSVLLVAAHPDDEILGCGGTARLHVLNDDEVHAIIVCEGESLRYGEDGVGQSSDTQNAAKIIGFRTVNNFRFPDQTLDRQPLTEIIGKLEKVVAEVRPNIVYCQFGGDVNHDHKVVFEATMVATRPTVECIESVYAFDTASSTEWAYPRGFVPDTWVDISAVLDDKLAAMACYKSEVRDFPHPRSLQGLRARAESWGVQACMKAAEVFVTVRQVRRNGKTPF